MKKKWFVSKAAAVTLAAVMSVAALPATVMAAEPRDYSDAYAAASSGNITATLPTSMEDSVKEDGTVVSGEEKLKAFLAAYVSYDHHGEYFINDYYKDNGVEFTGDLLIFALWTAHSDDAVVYDGDGDSRNVITKYGDIYSDPVITLPDGDTSGKSGTATVTVQLLYSVGDEDPEYEQDLNLTVKWGTDYAFPSRFTDVGENAYYAEAVAWGVKNNIVSGTSDTAFSPKADVTRAQFVTFLYRKAGSPDVAINRQFKDISGLSEEFQKAISWAAANGITMGVNDTTFVPNATVKREEAVTFLYRYMKKPSIYWQSSFKDVKAGAYYADAVSYAESYDVTHGVNKDTFGVGRNTTRGDAITFIFRSTST